MIGPNVIQFFMTQFNKIWDFLYSLKIIENLSIIDILLLVSVIGILTTLIYHNIRN